MPSQEQNVSVAHFESCSPRPTLDKVLEDVFLAYGKIAETFLDVPFPADLPDKDHYPFARSLNGIGH